MAVTPDPSLDLQKKIKRYYAEAFDPKPMLELFGDSPFGCREFGYETFRFNDHSKRFYFARNVSFASPDEFRLAMVGAIPRKLYFGALYDQPLKGSIKGAIWKESHLKFDIDITDSKYIRKSVCDCEGKHICPKCFDIGKEAVQFLIETLDCDFAHPKHPILKYLGKNEARIFLSGSRGFHVHYPKVTHLHSVPTERMDRMARRKLIEYISIVTEKPDLHLTTDHIPSIPLRKRVEAQIVAKFFGELAGLGEKGEEIFAGLSWLDITKGKWLKVEADKIHTYYNKVMGKLAFLTDPFTETFADENKLHYKKIMENALLYRYPRFDGSPTFDTRKVIKVPMSVDGSTGNIVHEIKNLSSFTMKDILTVDHMLR